MAMAQVERPRYEEKKHEQAAVVKEMKKEAPAPQAETIVKVDMYKRDARRLIENAPNEETRRKVEEMLNKLDRILMARGTDESKKAHEAIMAVAHA
ncbi:MAG: hypothetical protein QXP42_00850 [Candidatus Micrarchaeia archaeon]